MILKTHSEHFWLNFYLLLLRVHCMLITECSLNIDGTVLLPFIVGKSPARLLFWAENKKKQKKFNHFILIDHNETCYICYCT